MVADVITLAIVGLNFCRTVVSIEGMWRPIYLFRRHLAVVAFHIVLQVEAQNVLLSAYLAG